jgi:hypothetical protein
MLRRPEKPTPFAEMRVRRERALVDLGEGARPTGPDDPLGAGPGSPQAH